MINGTETPGQPDLEALMGRVREAAGRRRHGGAAAAPPPVSLDGILQRQAELNDALVQAVALLSRQIAELKQAPPPAVAPTPAPAPEVTTVSGDRRITIVIEQ